MTVPAAALSGVAVRYDRRTVIEDVSLNVAPGTVHALLGRNGAGKTSLIRVLLGMQRPACGRALLFGRDAWRHRAAGLTRVGVVPETPDVPPDITVARASAFCAAVHYGWDAAATARRLDALGIPARAVFRDLSRGQKTLVQVALALGHRPDLLVLDDPTLGLDAVARRDVLDAVVAELADHGAAVLLATHDLAATEGLADRVGILANAGAGPTRLLVDEPADAIRSRFRRLSLALRPGADRAALVAGLAPLDVRSHAFLGDVAEVAVAKWNAATFAAVGPAVHGALAAPPPEPAALSLEDVFLAVAGPPTVPPPAAPGGAP